jgi:uncharacterized oligopeptide transporter (OPT) family protein
MNDPAPNANHGLPENAFRELGPGETYEPIVPASSTSPEYTVRSVVFGLAMTLLFSMAATYLALKVGQGIEIGHPHLHPGGRATPASCSRPIRRRKSTIIENINILAISATAGMVAGGTVFTMPAIYLLKINEKLDLSSSCSCTSPWCRCWGRSSA